MMKVIICFFLILLFCFYGDAKEPLKLIDVKVVHSGINLKNDDTIFVKGYYTGGTLYQNKHSAYQLSEEFIGVSFSGEPTIEFYKNCEYQNVSLKGKFLAKGESHYYNHIVLISVFENEKGDDCLALVKKRK